MALKDEEYHRKVSREMSRDWNRDYAHRHGYFWLPCPICGKYFGGHEWFHGNTVWVDEIHGEGVCPKCGEGIASRAEAIKATRKELREREYNKEI